MKLATALLVLAGLMPSTAMALDMCVPAPEDPHTRICDYNPRQRYAITGIQNFPVNITFGPNETIKRDAPAYTGVDDNGKPTAVWRGPQCGDNGADNKCQKDRYITNAPIWPYGLGHSSMVIVTSLNSGQERAYQFDLTSVAPEPNCRAHSAGPGCPEDVVTVSAVEFTYSADDKAAQAEEAKKKRQEQIAWWRDQQAKKEEQTALARLKVDVLYGKRNFAYRAVGEPKYNFLAPSEVSDNGYLTEFQWPGNRQAPSISILNPVTHEEFMVTPDVQSGMHVVNRTAEWWRLRLGKEAVIDIHNLGFTAQRADPQTGTSSPSVVREILYQDGRK